MQQVLQSTLQLGAVDRMNTASHSLRGRCACSRCRLRASCGPTAPPRAVPTSRCRAALQGVEALQLLLLLLFTQAPQKRPSQRGEQQQPVTLAEGWRRLHRRIKTTEQPGADPLGVAIRHQQAFGMGEDVPQARIKTGTLNAMQNVGRLPSRLSSPVPSD